MSDRIESPISLALIAAVADNGVIGRDNRLPWHLPEELQYFKRVTLGKPVLMGRRTFESIGRPLPGRDNIVVSRNWHESPAGVRLCRSPEEGVALARQCALERGTSEVMIIGGGELYRWALPLADRLYLTLVHVDVDGDARFPEWRHEGWREAESELCHSESGLDYSLTIWEKEPK